MPSIAGIAATGLPACRLCDWQGNNKMKAAHMNWDHSEDDWLELKGNVSERWGDLSDCQLADRVQQTYGLTDADDEAQRQFSDWQLRLSEIALAAQRNNLQTAP
jgi:uncharacterized protein YjbJ (UPF0337 family)